MFEIEISKPSSPVYPDLVTYRFSPSYSKLFPVINFKLATPGINFSKISTDLGPCNAIKDKSLFKRCL